MGDKRIKIGDLRSFCTEALEKAGLKREFAIIAAGALSETDGYGTHSHGTKNLHNYIRKSREGGIDIKAEPAAIKDGPAFAVIDAHKSIGMIPSVQAMELACQKAEQTGVGFVTVRNSNHFGAAGYYANIAAKRGMIGITVSNVDPNMNAPGAREKALGNNPVAFACPSRKFPTVFLDIAMSNVASLKVFQARAEGSKIPENWIVDKDGLPTDDPSRYPDEGAMQPMAAHKGYGLAVMVDVLTGALSGGATSMSGDIVSWVLSLAIPNNVCHTFIAVNAAMFCDESEFADRVELMAEQLRSLPKAKGSKRIYLPGEIEWERYKKAEKEGIALPGDLLESLYGLAREFSLTLPVF
ncbi:MAG: Ldh family oxidoreductase [Oscillospiraceae bacterium]|nr:Ldh family oxidoreductase [Oscillospiraceae bacterium]